MKKDNFQKGEIIIYKTSKNEVSLDVRLEEETVWLTLDQMALLFGRDKSVISRHIKNIFQERELNRKAVVAKIATTASDGKVYQVDYYSLDVIISVGYRVKSNNGVKFRIWATKTLKEHLLKGYTINEKDYWKPEKNSTNCKLPFLFAGKIQERIANGASRRDFKSSL